MNYLSFVQLQRKKQAMKLLAAFITVIIFSFRCEMSSYAELESVLFDSRYFNFLNVTRVQTRLVNSHIQCSFACLQNALCFSFNAAVSADSKGKFICQLLSSSLYKDEGKLFASKKFHHYSSLTKVGGDGLSDKLITNWLLKVLTYVYSFNLAGYKW